MDNKPVWQSRTLWGGVMVLVALVAALLKVQLPDDWKESMTDSIVAVAVALDGLIGLVMIFVGRFKAKTKLTLK